MKSLHAGLLLSFLSLVLTASCTGVCPYKYVTTPTGNISTCNPYGRSTRLECTIIVSPNIPATVKWFYNENTPDLSEAVYVNSSSPLYEVNNKDNQTYSLTVHNFTNSDRGYYWCVIVVNDTVGLRPPPPLYIPEESTLMQEVACDTIPTDVSNNCSLDIINIIYYYTSVTVGNTVVTSTTSVHRTTGTVSNIASSHPLPTRASTSTHSQLSAPQSISSSQMLFSSLQHLETSQSTASSSSYISLSIASKLLEASQSIGSSEPLPTTASTSTNSQLSVSQSLASAQLSLYVPPTAFTFIYDTPTHHSQQSVLASSTEDTPTSTASPPPAAVSSTLYIAVAVAVSVAAILLVASLCVFVSICLRKRSKREKVAITEAHPVSNIGQFHENYTATTGTELESISMRLSSIKQNEALAQLPSVSAKGPDHVYDEASSRSKRQHSTGRNEEDDTLQGMSTERQTQDTNTSSGAHNVQKMYYSEVHDDKLTTGDKHYPPSEASHVKSTHGCHTTKPITQRNSDDRVYFLPSTHCLVSDPVNHTKTQTDSDGRVYYLPSTLHSATNVYDPVKHTSKDSSSQLTEAIYYSTIPDTASVTYPLPASNPIACTHSSHGENNQQHSVRASQTAKAKTLPCHHQVTGSSHKMSSESSSAVYSQPWQAVGRTVHMKDRKMSAPLYHTLDCSPGKDKNLEDINNTTSMLEELPSSKSLPHSSPRAFAYSSLTASSQEDGRRASQKAKARTLPCHYQVTESRQTETSDDYFSSFGESLYSETFSNIAGEGAEQHGLEPEIRPPLILNSSENWPSHVITEGNSATPTESSQVCDDHDVSSPHSPEVHFINPLYTPVDTHVSETPEGSSSDAVYSEPWQAAGRKVHSEGNKTSDASTPFYHTLENSRKVKATSDTNTSTTG